MKILVILLFFSLSLLSQETPRETKDLLIIPFQVNGELEKKRLNFIMETVRNEIKRKGIYNVFDLQLAEQLMVDKADVLRGCVGNQCSAALGRAGGAEWVLDGEITAGTSDTVSIRLIRPESGETEFTDSFEVKRLEEMEKNMEPFLKRLDAFSRGVELPPESSKWKYVGYSAAFPGWGQRLDGRSDTSLLYGGTFIVLGLNYFLKYTAFNSAEKKYKSAPFLPATSEQDTYALNYILLQGPKKTYKAAETEVNTAAYLLGSFYLWNLFDAYYFSERDSKGLSSFRFQAAPRFVQNFSADFGRSYRETYYEAEINIRF